MKLLISVACLFFITASAFCKQGDIKTEIGSWSATGGSIRTEVVVNDEYVTANVWVRDSNGIDSFGFLGCFHTAITRMFKIAKSINIEMKTATPSTAPGKVTKELEGISEPGEKFIAKLVTEGGNMTGEIYACDRHFVNSVLFTNLTREQVFDLQILFRKTLLKMKEELEKHPANPKNAESISL